MIVSAVRGVCFALIGLVAAVAVVGQELMPHSELTWGELSAPPGTYAHSVSLYPQGSRELEYRFLDGRGEPHTSYFLPLTGGLELHAPDDTEIRYSIAVRRVGQPDTTIAGEFVLDTLAPAAPRMTPPPGLHTTPINLVPESESPGDRVSLRIIDDEASRFTPVPVDGVRLSGEPGSVQDYRIAAYAVDASDNRSSVATSRYRIDRSPEAAPAVQPVQSPRPGTYANEQLLLIDDTGLTNLSVTLNRPEADQVPVNYREMPVIRGAGTFSIVIEGTVRSSGESYRQTVTWNQSVTEDLPTQGQATSAVRLRPPPGRPRYKLEDRPVTKSDPYWLRLAELAPPPEGTRPVVVRYRTEDEDHDTRLMFLLDGRRAPTPELAPTATAGVVTAYSLAGTEVQWAPLPATGDASFTAPAIGVARVDLATVSADEIVVRARFPGGPWTRRIVPVGNLRSTSPATPASFSDDGVSVSVDSPGTFGELTIREEESGLQLLRFSGTFPFRWRPPPGFLMEVRSGEERAITATIDRTPLAPPTIEVEEDRLLISGSGQIFYRLDGSPDAVYEAPVELSGVANARRRYRVDAYRIVDGYISPTVTAYPVIDRRQPIVPAPQIVPGTERSSGEFISREELTRVVFSSPYEDLQLYYEISSDGEALLPQMNSPRVDEAIRLTTPDEREVRWAIRVRGRFPGRNRWSPLYQLVVMVDRQPPAMPVLISDPQESGVVAFESPPEGDTSIWYRLRESDTYRRYQGPVTIDRDRIENALTINAYARDVAGNRTFLTDSLVVEPLNQGPAPPQLAVNGRVLEEPRIVLPREAVLEVVAPEDVRWRIREVSSHGESGQFHPVSDPQVLSRGTYRINAYRERGSERSRVVEKVVTIDPERPRTPDPPYVSYAPDGRSGTVYWAGAQSERIFASIVTDPKSEPGIEPFSVSEGTLSWTIPEGASRVSLVYFSVGEAGERSETEILQLEAARARPPAHVSGVSDGKRYRTERAIQFIGEGDVRFTATTDGSSPGPVRLSSALYEEPLLVSASVGETAQYRIRYRTFEGDTPVSEERHISFVVDRDPPSAPQLQGASPDGYYGESRSVRLASAGDGDTIMYRIRTASSAPPDFSSYTGEEIFLAEDDTEPRHYRIDAYAVDRAGNRSTGIATWNVTIDATSLHVAASVGDDESGDGSRQAPLASLEAALRTVSRSSRDTIFLTAGDYTVSAETLAAVSEARHSLNLLGGYDPESWLAGASDTSITHSDGDEFTIPGTLRLERLSLSQQLRVGTSATPGHVVLRHVEIRTVGTPGIVQVGGDLTLFESTVPRGIEVGSGSSFEARGSAMGSVSIHGGVATISDSIMTGVRISGGSSLVVTDSRISADRSVDIGGLVYADASTLKLRSSLVQSTAEDPILIRGRDAHIEVAGSLIYGEGVRSAIAIRARGGRVAVSDSILDTASGGYGYGLSLRDSATSITGSAVILRVTGDGVVIAAGDSALSIRDSILWITGTNNDSDITATGISVDGSGIDDLMVRDSVILAHGARGRTSAGVRLGSDGAARILENSFAGWPTSLIRGTAADAWEMSGRFPSVDDLNRSRFGNANRRSESPAPPQQSSTPSIPEAPVPAELLRLRATFARR
ncbi:MAG: right-handed parallel beta-helix repeat-containing protein [Alkalispirochaeta sp.]